MNARSSSSLSYSPNFQPGIPSDDTLIRGFILALGAAGRKETTLYIYDESIRSLSSFAKERDLPGLATMDRHVVREWMSSLHQKGNKPATVSVRYRSLNRFFNWCVSEEERKDNPMDRIDPPRVPDTIQPYYSPQDVEKVIKAITPDNSYHLRDKALLLTLYDTGVRAAELCGMLVNDLDWREQTITVTGKADKQRKVSIGRKTAQAIERYLRRRRVDSEWLWIGNNESPLGLSGLRMMLNRRFNKVGITFKGAHGFRRGFAMEYLASGGQQGDLKELGGWENYAMVSRYAKANANERAVVAHKKLSPGDKLNVS